MDPSGADSALATCIPLRVYRERPPALQFDVLMPVHFITTTDSVESISGGLAKSPSEVLNPPSSSLKAAGGRV